MDEIEIEKEPKDCYSYVGKFSMEKIMYLLDRKSHIDKKLSKKKKNGEINYDLLQEENSDLSFLQNGIGLENIFSDNYESKHESELNMQKFKYFDNVKNPCTHIENKVKKSIIEKNEKLKKNRKARNRDINENEEKIKEKNDSLNKMIAKSELQKIIESGYNFNYYHHLSHHTYNDNYYIENNKNEIKIGPNINATRYNPKLDFVYPKIIYSPSFKLMKGRYDKEHIIEKLKNTSEQKNINKKSIENETIKENDSNIENKTMHRIKKLNVKKNKELKKSKSFINNKYIKEDTISINSLIKNKTIINENTTKENENNNSGSNNNNNNDTLFTSKAIKNVYYKDSNSNNSNNLINANKNMVLNNAYLTARLSKFHKNGNNKKNIRKINNINKEKFPNIFSRKEENSSSLSNIYKSCKNKNTLSIINKTLSNNNSDTNIFSFKERIMNQSKSGNKSKNKKEILFSLRGPNFNKMLGRGYIHKLPLKIQMIHPQLNPNWNSIEPKCIMKVMYSNSLKNNKSMNKFKGINEEVTFDINKIYNNYNNHFKAKSFYFKKMIGRTNNKDGNILPSYMINISNRNSCDNLNEKSLMMNNYSEAKFKDPISSFNQQKSFNNKLNMNKENLNISNIEIKNNENDAFKIFMNMIRNNKKNRKKKFLIPNQDFMSISYKSKLKELPEFYKINLDSITREKEIDGITYKTIKKTNKRNEILSDEDKKIFSINFDDNN